MNLEYLRDQIHEELEGAHEYVKRAIEFKSSKTEWANAFYSMAQMELDHAMNLREMFNEKYDIIIESYSEDNRPPYLVDCKDEVTKLYQTLYPTVRYLMELYSK